MLITLLGWLYISLVCHTWGTGIHYNIKEITGNNKDANLPFSITCLLGFASVTVIASTLSLFMPLGGWSAQLVIILPCFLFAFQKRKRYSPATTRNEFIGLHPSIIVLLFSFIILILVMSGWTINHPDTLGYHSQTIQWIEKYKAVPGLVHLQTRYGYQGLWFVSCATFSFKFFNGDTLTFINSTILIWYFIFISQKINESIFRKNNIVSGYLWISLAALSMWSYTQVRLTATSASPDFIAALIIWTAILLLLEKKQTKRPSSHWLLIILFSVFAITIKLSALPIIIISGFAAFKIIQKKKIIPVLIAILITAVIILPFVARNIISSGYIVFPSAYPDIVNVDWKLDKAQTQLEKDYITAYARNPVDRSPEKIKENLSMKLNEWLPIWWQNRSLSDKLFMILLVLAFMSVLIKFRMILKAGVVIWIALIASLAGCIFWFIQAPDLRFGFGFIVAFPAIVVSLFLENNWSKTTTYSIKPLIAFTIIFSFILGAYSFYRIRNFFDPHQLIQPLGIKKTASTIVTCNGIEFKIPEQDQECGSIAIPCIHGGCERFQLRGPKIEDGFKSK